MATYISPTGNPEVWEEKPDGYYTWEEWDALHPPPEPTLSEARAAKIAELAAYRHEVETGGVTIVGQRIKTDREAQAMIAGAAAFSDLNPSALIDWKGADGWVQIDRATVLAIAQAVGAHVQACFSAERSHAEAIGALEAVEDIAAYDFTTGWPE